MIGFGLDLLPSAPRASAPPFDPVAYMAARNLSMYLVGADWSTSTPAIWLGRASAGSSGNGKRFRRDRYYPATGYQQTSADPSATTVGGKQWVLANAAGSPMVLQNAASVEVGWFDSQAWGPGDWTMTACVRFDTLNRSSSTSGGSIAAAPSANGTIHPGVQSNGVVHLWQRSAASGNQAVASPSGLITAGEACVVQVQYQESTGILRFRKGKGAWYTFSGVATDRSPSGDLACIMNCLTTTAPFLGALGLFAVEQSFVTGTDLDTIVDACASIAGVSL